MASQSCNVHHRHYLLCPVCRKTQASLSVHLRRVCMKRATLKTLTGVVEKAKQDALQILQSGRIFTFSLLHKMMEDAKPLDRMIEELEHRHMVVTDVPAALLGAEAQSRPSHSTVTQPPATVTVESDRTEVSSDETLEITFRSATSVRQTHHCLDCKAGVKSQYPHHCTSS